MTHQPSHAPGGAPEPRAGRLGPGLQIALMVVISAAIVGYFVGLTGPREGGPVPWRPLPEGATTSAATSAGARPDLERPPLDPRTAAIPATSYSDMRASRVGPNREWSSSLASLVQPTVDPFAMADQRNVDAEVLLAELRDSLADRATRRAYNGAPPVVPHAVDQISAANCIACHGPGLAVEDRRASRMPHALLGNCVQCHVEQAGAAPTGTDGTQIAPLTVASAFVGLPAPENGERAWIGAPPTIPHSTLMRIDCLACHGPTGPLGMRSSHPWRANCLQCHAPSSVLDQIPAGTAEGPLPRR